MRSRARELRKNQTLAEAWIWKNIRAHRLGGFQFKRQVPIGSYIVDFYCHQKRLVIELDGGQHNTAEAVQYDTRRTQYLNAKGLKVLRFWNNEVFQQKEVVLRQIWNSLMSGPPPDFGKAKISLPQRERV